MESNARHPCPYAEFNVIFVQFQVIAQKYRQISNIRRTLVCHTFVDHSNVVGATPVGADPTTFSFPTLHLASPDLAKATARRDEKTFQGWDLVPVYYRFAGRLYFPMVYMPYEIYRVTMCRCTVCTNLWYYLEYSRNNQECTKLTMTLPLSIFS